MQTEHANKQPTLEEFKRWARAHKALALAVRNAQAFAEVEKERVDAYILPLFHTFDFRDTFPRRDGSISNKPLTNPEQLYLYTNEPLTTAYYAACDKAHRKHGFTGPEGECPALIAQELYRQAARILIEEACPLFGLAPEQLYFENREKFLHLIVEVCLK